jgi:hypothetical protein
MSDFINAVILAGVILTIIAAGIVISVLYYGAILWVILWVLKQFGILQHFGIELLWWVLP